MFDASFYQTVLTDGVQAECAGKPDMVPVVELHLATGTILDLCHIIRLADDWMACRFFRNPEDCEDMDVAFLPYGLVNLVTVSLHHVESRRVGFQLGAG